MSTRHSGYERQPNDAYWTPAWCYALLYEAEQLDVVKDAAPRDLHFDFLQQTTWRGDVVTNPPFNLAEKFARHALSLTEPYRGKVALLLPCTFDYARGRNDLFRHPAFKRKLVMLQRIRWLNIEQKAAGPSSNHCWMVWDWDHAGLPEKKQRACWAVTHPLAGRCASPASATAPRIDQRS